MKMPAKIQNNIILTKLIYKIMKRYQIIMNAKCIEDFYTWSGAFYYLSKKMLEMNEKSVLLMYDSHLSKIEFQIYKH